MRDLHPLCVAVCYRLCWVQWWILLGCLSLSATGGVSPSLELEDLGFRANVGTGSSGPILSIVEDSQQRLVLIGRFSQFNGSPANSIVRLLPDGRLDPTFGAELPPSVLGLSVIAAHGEGYLVVPSAEFGPLQPDAFGGIPALIRLPTDGTLDTAFEANRPRINNGRISHLAVQTDAGVLIAGTFTNINGLGLSRLLRIGADGKLDPTFLPAEAGPINGLLVARNGDSVVASNDLLDPIHRYRPNGSRDPNQAYGTFDLGPWFSVGDLFELPDQRLVLLYSPPTEGWHLAFGPDFVDSQTNPAHRNVVPVAQGREEVFLGFRYQTEHTGKEVVLITKDGAELLTPWGVQPGNGWITQVALTGTASDRAAVVCTTSMLRRFRIRTPPAGPPTLVRDIELVSPGTNLLHNPILRDSDASLYCDVVGTPPPTIQWFKDDRPIPHAHRPILPLYPLQITNEGAYRMVASNQFGMVQSRTVQIHSDPRPPTLIGVFETHPEVDRGDLRELTAMVTGEPPIGIYWDMVDPFDAQGSVVVVPTPLPFLSLTLSNAFGLRRYSPTVHWVPQLRSPTAIYRGDPLRVTAEVTLGSLPERLWWVYQGEAIPADRDALSFQIPQVTGPPDLGLALVRSNALMVQTSRPPAVSVFSEPLIHSHPLSIVGRLDNPVEISIEAYGGPEATARWLFNDKLVAIQTNPVLPGPIKYRVPRLDASQIGSYQLIVNDRLGSVTSAPVVVDIGTAPRIRTPLPARVDAIEGHPVSLVANVEGFPNPTVQWKAFSTGDQIIHSGIELRFAEASLSHGDSYAFVASNLLGQVTSAWVWLNVQYPPRLRTNPPASLRRLRDQEVQITASALGNPIPTLQWEKDGLPVAGQTNESFYLPQAAPEDSGSYVLVARNDLGSWRSSPCKLLVPDVRPTIITQPVETARVPRGGYVDLRVTADAAPLPEYQWWFAHQPIPGATSNVLSIRSIWETNVGNYFVVVSNRAGTVTSSNTTVSLVATPDKPGTVEPTFRADSPAALDRVNAVLPLEDGSVWVGGSFRSLAGIPVTNLAVLHIGASASVQVVPVGSDSEVGALWLQPGGKVLVNNGALNRFFPDGRPDPAFVGVSTLAFRDAPLLAIREDGWFYAVGFQLNDLAIRRFTPLGETDSLFAPLKLCSRNPSLTLGPWETPLCAYTPGLPCSSDQFLASFPDGTVDQASIERIKSSKPAANILGAVRFWHHYPDGTLLGTDDNGWVRLDRNYRWTRLFHPRPSVLPWTQDMTSKTTSSVSLLEDGSSIVTGSFAYSGPSGSSERGPAAVLRYSATFEQDTNFASVFPKSTRLAEIRTAGVLADGRILVGGSFQELNGIRLYNLGLLKGVPPSPPTVEESSTELRLTVGEKVVLEAKARGSARMSFQWLRDGVPIPSGNSRWLSLPRGSLSDGGLYSVVVSNSMGVATGVQARITIDPVPLSATHLISGGSWDIDGPVWSGLELVNGKLLLGGAFQHVRGVSCPGLALITPDGKVDEEFAHEVRQLAADGRPFEVHQLLRLPSGKIMVGGGILETNGLIRDAVLRRLNPDGRVDTRFSVPTGWGVRSGPVTAIAATETASLLIHVGRKEYGDSSFLHTVPSDGAADPGWGSRKLDVTTYAIHPLPGDRSLLGIQTRSGSPLMLQTPSGISPILLSTRFTGRPSLWSSALPVPSGGGGGSSGFGAGIACFHQLAGGAFLAGGELRMEGTLSTNHLIRLELSGTNAIRLTHLMAFTGGPLHFLRPLGNGKLLVGGRFTAVQGQPRGGLALLTPDGATLLDDDFGGGASLGGLPGIFSGWECADGRLAIGGSFYQFGGRPLHNLALILGELRLPALSIPPSPTSLVWGLEGHHYQLQRSRSLSPIEWHPVGTWPGTNGFLPLERRDDAQLEGFYRILAE